MGKRHPKIGDVARAKDVELGTGHHKVMWAACGGCGAARWAVLCYGQPQNRLCYACRAADYAEDGIRPGSDHHRWKGSRRITKTGYVRVWVDPEGPWASMLTSSDWRVFEHRLVMAKHIGRPLKSDEDVHHINGDKEDNRVENLRLLSKTEHGKLHGKRVKDLEKEFRRLQKELQEVRGR